MPIAQIETAYYSTQVDIPGDVTVMSPSKVKGKIGTTRIFITPEAAKLLPPDTKIVSVSEGGMPGTIKLLSGKKEESKILPNVLIPPDIPQYIDFEVEDEAFY